ncbi:hypothetical protein HY492_01370, partial [Candidatus Woesearchaeota archaeon]|nr:hypothetical protein [Candidatus Woesearchaeota archaeon]
LMPRLTLRVHEPEKVTNIESKVEIREVERHQIKVIETSDAWKEHQKHHQGAKLTMLGTTDEKALSGMEKEVVKAGKQQQDKDVEEMSKKPQDPLEQAKFSYKQANATEEKDKKAYGSHSHNGVVMASCNCGQVFKADEQGVSPYKLGANVETVSPFEAMGYKKKEDGSGSYHKKSAIEEMQDTKYGRG